MRRASPLGCMSLAQPSGAAIRTKDIFSQTNRHLAPALVFREFSFSMRQISLRYHRFRELLKSHSLRRGN